jgi:hypothetical protein
VADPTDPTELTEQGLIERKTLRESISGRIETERQAQIAAEQAKLKQRRTERENKRKKERLDRVTAQKQKRQAVLTESQTKIQRHVGDATKALQGAIRVAQDIPLSRYSPEGREQMRIIRSLRASLESLRDFGRSSYSSSDGVDLDFDDVE